MIEGISRSIASLVFFASTFLIAGCGMKVNASVAAAAASTTTPTPSPAVAPAAITLTGPPSIQVGGSAQFTALVTGVKNPVINWSVNQRLGGTTATGTISASGLYLPPAVVPQANTIVISAAVAASSLAANANVSLLQPLPVIATATASTQDSGDSFLIDVTGSGFQPGAQILVAGTPVVTGHPAADHLQATIADPTAAPMQIAVSVQNANPGSTVSTTVSMMLAASTASSTAAARFLDQTSFGPTTATIAHVQKIGLEASLREQFLVPPTLYSSPPYSSPECLNETFRCTRSEFLNVAVFGNDQLRQRVALALSEIWVAPTLASNALPYYLNTLSTVAFMNYRTIMEAITLTPEMGEYLNMLNSAGNNSSLLANENFAREMMQLFTIGLAKLNPDGAPLLDATGNPVATFTEPQMQAFARAYTGWTFARADGTKPTDFVFIPNRNHKMVPVERRHDSSQKFLLHGTVLPAGQSAEQDLKGALDDLFADENVGPFVCRQLIQHLVTGNPTPAYVGRVAAAFADNGHGIRGDMQAVISAIVMDEEARSADVQSGDQADNDPVFDAGHLREPLLWAMNILRALHAAPKNPLDPYPYVAFLTFNLGGLGEAPFTQSSVFNYFPPQYLIPQSGMNSPEFGLENTGTVIPRQTLADAILHNHVAGIATDLGLASEVGLHAVNPTGLVDFLAKLFMHNQMSGQMRTQLISTLSAIPATSLEQRAQVAVFLIVTSAEYKIIH